METINGTETKFMELEQKFESIKLMKMSKGWNWEIRVLPRVEQSDTDFLNRLENINNEMIKRFLSLDLN